MDKQVATSKDVIEEGTFRDLIFNLKDSLTSREIPWSLTKTLIRKTFNFQVPGDFTASWQFVWQGIKYVPFCFYTYSEISDSGYPLYKLRTQLT